MKSSFHLLYASTVSLSLKFAQAVSFPCLENISRKKKCLLFSYLEQIDHGYYFAWLVILILFVKFESEDYHMLLQDIEWLRSITNLTSFDQGGTYS